jgi:hypothetical protein
LIIGRYTVGVTLAVASAGVLEVSAEVAALVVVITAPGKGWAVVEEHVVKNMKIKISNIFNLRCTKFSMRSDIS